MGQLSTTVQYSGPVSGFSGSGNPVIRKSAWDKRVVVVTDETKPDYGEKITFTIQKEHDDHYQATIPGEGAEPVSKPDYSSSPNVPIHHDGKHGQSVTDTRSKKQSFASPEERDFNPKTHGAPDPPNRQKDRKFLRADSDSSSDGDN
jgi:hypothetical protein